MHLLVLISAATFLGYLFRDVHVISAAQNGPKLLSYQARVTDALGVPVPDGPLSVKILLWDSASGGTCVYAIRGTCGTPTAKTVTVTNGIFSTIIGDTGDNTLSDAQFDADAVYLGLAVGSDAEMTPRKRLGAVAYAFNADRLDDMDSTTTGAATSILATGAGGALTLTGDVTVDTNTLFVDATNNQVGIGTTSMTASGANLEVRATSAPILAVRNDATFQATMRIGDSFFGGSNNVAQFGSVNTSPVEIIGGLGKAIIAAPQDADYLVFNTLSSSGTVANERIRIISSGNVGIGTTGPGTLLQLGNSGTLKGVISFAGNTSGLVTVQPAASAGTYTLTLPTDDGTSGQVLSTDGTGVLSWATAGGISGSGSSGHVSYWSGASSQTYDSDGNFYWDATNNRLGIGTAAPSELLHVVGGTLVAGRNALEVSATMPATTSGDKSAVVFNITSAGSASSSQYGVVANMLAGYTGDYPTIAFVASNEAAGIGAWNPLTGTDFTNGPNLGYWGQSVASTVGTNVGGYNRAYGGAISIGSHGIVGSNAASENGFRADSLDIGVLGTTVLTKHSSSTTERHLGVVGLALGGDTNVGGYFGLQSGTPTFASAALIADNGSVSAPIFVARDNGAEQFRIDNGGNVGIATSSPGSALDVKGTLRLSGSTSGYVGFAPAATAGSTTYTLPSADGSSGNVLSTNGSGTLSWSSAGSGTVTGTGSSGALAFWNGTSSITQDASNLFWDDTNNRLGIGTASPSVAFHLAGSTSGFLEHYQINTNTAGSAVAVIGEGSVGGNYGIMGRVGSTYSPVGANIHQIPKMYFLYNSDQAGGDLGLGATASDGNVRIFAGGVVAATYERMRITSGGNVGIGDTTPDAILDVDKNQNAETLIQITNTTDGAASQTGFTAAGATSADYLTMQMFAPSHASAVFQDRAAIIAGSGMTALSLFHAGGGPIEFHTDDAPGNMRMIIAGSGNVGIGDTTPDALLDLDSASTSGNIFGILSTGVTSGNVADLSMTAASTGNLLNITSTSATATAKAINIDLDNGNVNNDVFVLTTDETTVSGTAVDTVKARIAASGEFFSDVGFTAGGASTKYYDGSIDSSGALTINATNNQAISTGTGAISLNGDTTIGAGKRLASPVHAANAGFKLPTYAGIPPTLAGNVEGDAVWDSTNNQLYVFDGSAFAAAAAGLSGAGGASGRVAFWTGGSTLSNNANFFWDDGATKLGIGTGSPSEMLSVGSSNQFTVNASGTVVSASTLSSTRSFVGNGTEGLPGFAFTNAATTGLFRPAADTLGFTANGTEGMRLTSSGKILIGNTTGTELLSVGTASQFTVNATGEVSTSNNYLTTGTGRFKSQDGSASSPAFTFTSVGNDDNGMYLSAANELSLSTAGSQALVIDAMGSVGIGDPSPASLFTVGTSDAFQVNANGDIVKIEGVTYDWPSSQGASGTSLTNDGSGGLTWSARAAISGTPVAGRVAYWSSATDIKSNASLFFDEGTNRLGIGTSSPSAMLHIESTTPYEVLRGDATSGAYGAIRGQRSDGTLASPSATSADVTLLAVQGMGYGTSFQLGSEIDFDTTETWSATARGSRIVFKTVDNTTTTQDERMRIDQDGEVGIGLTAPSSILDINGALTVQGMSAPSASPSGDGRIYFDSTSNTFKVSENGGGYVDLIANATAGGWTDDGTIVRLTTGTDQVRIGTTAAGNSQALEVNGVIRSITGGIQYPDGTIQTTAAATSSGVTSATDVNVDSDNDASGGGDTIFSTGTVERARILASGNFGIGDATPAGFFTVGSGDPFQINSSGTITSVQGIYNLSGSISVPAYGFAADSGTNSGLYYEAEDAVNLTTGGGTFLTQFNNSGVAIGLDESFAPTTSLQIGTSTTPRFTVTGSTGDATSAGVITSQSRFAAADGTISVPGYNFTSDSGSNSGLYYESEDSINLTTGGGTFLTQFNNSGVAIGLADTFTPSTSLQIGTGSTPRFTVSGSSGDVTAAGTWTVQTKIYNADGTISVPAYNFTSDSGSNSGLYYESEDSINLTTGGGTFLTQFNNSGVAIGLADTFTPSTSLQIGTGSTPRFTVSGSSGDVTAAGTWTVQTKIYNADGTISVPAYNFTSDSGSNSGLYYESEDSINLTTGGGTFLTQFNNSGVAIGLADTFTPSTSLQIGTGSTPRFTVSGSSGDVTAAGTWTVQSRIANADGTISVPAYNFTNDSGTNSGLYYEAEDSVNLTTGGGTFLTQFNNSGVAIGFTDTFTPSASLQIGTATTSRFSVVGSTGAMTTVSATATDFFALPNGAPSTPAMRFSVDADTGIYHGGTDDNIMYFVTGSTDALIIDASQNVGIGDTTPTEAKLVVGAAGAGNIYATFATTASTERLCWDGTGASLIDDCAGSPGDYAEEYGTSDVTMEAGDIVMMDASRAAAPITKDGLDTSTAWMVKSDRAYAPLLIGVVSTSPNEKIGQAFEPDDHAKPVALNGRVPVKVSTENGSIAIGDPITSSSVAGVGMKATQNGMIVGFALSAYDGTGTGSVIMFVSTGWWNGSTVQTGNTSSGVTSPQTLQIYSDVNFAGYSITNIRAIHGGNWSIDENGFLIAKSVTADNFVVRVSDEKATIGQGTIASGVQSVFVSNASVKATSKVFVTWRTSPGSFAVVSEIHDGNFTVALDAPAVRNAAFDYWIVDVLDMRSAPAVPAPLPPAETTTLTEPATTTTLTEPATTTTLTEPAQVIIPSSDPAPATDPAPAPVPDPAPTTDPAPAPVPDPAPVTDPAPATDPALIP